MEICNHKLVSYPGDNLTVLGTVELPVKSKSDVYQEPTFHVLEKTSARITVFRSSQNLGLIKVVMTTEKEQEETYT